MQPHIKCTLTVPIFKVTQLAGGCIYTVHVGSKLAQFFYVVATCICKYICSPQYMGEWRRLNLNFLRQRIQRLVVLMDLSEPGTVPDSGMLASLIDLVGMYTYNHGHVYIKL